MRRSLLLAGLLCSGCYASHAEPDGGPHRRCYLSCASGEECPPLHTCGADGECHFNGCLSDDDCPPMHGCAAGPLISAPSNFCALRCSETADCAPLIDLQDGPLECADGLCTRSGCPSTEWCNLTLGPSTGFRYECERWPGMRVALCLSVCERDTECQSLSPQPYQCSWLGASRAGICTTVSCSSDEECRAWRGDPRLRCSGG